MSAHPNVILIASLTPDDLARKTMRQILELHGVGENDLLKISGKEYHHLVMESDYHEGWQIGGEEGDLLFFDLVTYGYGETVKWLDLEAQKNQLEAWAQEMCRKFACRYEIIVTANHW